MYFLSGLIFTTPQVVFITAKIAFIFGTLSAVHLYDFHIFTVNLISLIRYNRIAENFILRLNDCKLQAQFILLVRSLLKSSPLLLSVEDTVDVKQSRTKRLKNEENNENNMFIRRCSI